MTITTLREAEQALQPYVPLVAQLTGKDTTLERIVPLMELLGNPQDKLKAVHIAGTSGKTSTAYYVSALFQAAGQKTGLTVSPHIDSINERVQINGQPLSEAEFCTLLSEFLPIVERARMPPSYFELLYAFALWVFCRYEVDYAVVETGLGGLLDATNILTRTDKVCVITDIGFDHVSILGKTLAAIAAQKIGIVHDHNTVLMYEQNEEIMTVVHDWVESRSAELRIVPSQTVQTEFTDHMASFQQRNWLLASTVYEYVSNRDNLQHLTRQALRETQATYVPARMDVTQHSGKTVVMDGAHNAQKMSAFVASFRTLFLDTKPAVLLALKEGKDYIEVVPIIAGFASRVIITTFNTSQDLPAISMNSEVLKSNFMQHGYAAVVCVANQLEAYETLLSGPESVVVVTGSFYLLSQLRHTKH